MDRPWEEREKNAKRIGEVLDISTDLSLNKVTDLS
jgi:hypothetical protein